MVTNSIRNLSKGLLEEMEKDNIRLADIKSEINSFPWEDDKRNFREDQFFLNKKYWECVSGDILNHFEELTSSGSQDFNKRFVNSFLGCYYFRSRLEKNILSQFNGYHIRYFSKEQKAWEEWKEDLKKVEKEFISIPCLIERHKNKYIKGPNYSDISVFDDYHENKADKVSNLLNPHIVESDNFVALREFPKVYLPLTLNKKSDLIKSLLKYAHSYIRVIVIENVMIQVEKQFSDADKITAYPKMSPIEAVRKALSKNSNLKKISAKRLAYFICDTYRDKKGLPLSYDSVLTAITRIRSSR